MKTIDGNVHSNVIASVKLAFCYNQLISGHEIRNISRQSITKMGVTNPIQYRHTCYIHDILFDFVSEIRNNIER